MKKIKNYFTTYQFVGCITDNIEVGFVEPVFRTINILGQLGTDVYRGKVDNSGTYAEFQPITLFQNTVFKEQNQGASVKVKKGGEKLYAVAIGHDVGLKNRVGQYVTAGRSWSDRDVFYCHVGSEQHIAQIVRKVLAESNNVANNPTSTIQLRSWYTFLQEYDKLTKVFFMDFLADMINPVCCMGYFDSNPHPDKLNLVLTHKNPTLGELFWQEYLQGKSLSMKKLRKLFDVETIINEYEWLFDDWMRRGYIDTQIDILERNGKIKVPFKWELGIRAKDYFTYSDKLRLVIKHTINTYLKDYLSGRIGRESIINEKLSDTLQGKAILDNYLLPHQEVVIEERHSHSAYDTWLGYRTRYEPKQKNETLTYREQITVQDLCQLRNLGFRNATHRVGDFEREIRW